MRSSDWSSDVCSSDLQPVRRLRDPPLPPAARRHLRAVGHDQHLRFRRQPGKPLADGGGDRAADAPVDLVEDDRPRIARSGQRSEEHTSELQSLMRISYAVFCLKKKIHTQSVEVNNRLLANLYT